MEDGEHGRLQQQGGLARINHPRQLQQFPQGQKGND
jgi:hypothetical protein